MRSLSLEYWVQVHTIGALLFLESNISISQLHTRIPLGLCLLGSTVSKTIRACCLTHHFLQMGEGNGGAVEEVGLEPPLLITAVADSGTCKIKKNSLGRRTSMEGKSK